MATETTTKNVLIDGNVSPLRQKLREAAAEFNKFGQEGARAVGGMTGPLAVLQSKFIAIGGLLAGGAIFKEAVSQAAQFTEESTKLGRALGISASMASVLREALTAGNTSQEEFVGAAKGLAKQLIENEAVLQAMGLRTRDAAGQLRPLNELTLDAISLLNQYRAGTDRALAGQTLFGKGFEMTSNLANMNKEAVAAVNEQMRNLGLVASVESVAAFEAFDDAGDKANLVLKGIKTTIGNALMPALAQLGEWFAATGPAVVTAFRGAIGGLVSVFWGLRTSAVIAFETIKSTLFSIQEPLRAIGAAFLKLIQGDFKGALNELVSMPQRIGASWAYGWDTMVAEATKARDAMWNLFARGTDTAAPGRGGKSATGLIKDDKDKKAGGEPSFMQYYEAELAQRKAAFEQENSLRQFSKEQELAYWRELQANLDLTSKDRVAIAKRTAMLELEIRRQSAKEQRDLDSVMVDSRRAAGLAQLQFEEQQANFARENGDLTKRQLLEIEEQFARRRFEIEYQALLERLELAKSDPNASPAELLRIKEQMLEVERNYQLRRGEIQQGQKKEESGLGGFFAGVGDSFGQMANSLLTKATTLQQALGTIFQGIYQSFVANLISKPLGEWAAGLAKMLAIKLGFLAEEKAADATAVVASKIAKKAEGFTGVQANAAVAATGAAASQASIPIVGPMLAMAAMAQTFAQVSGFGTGMLAVAAKGFDIPKGLNPLTQLHEEEMVLPKHLANVVRGMAGGGGAVPMSSGDTFNWHITTPDPRAFRDFLKANSHALVPALKAVHRNFQIDGRGR